MWDIAFFVQKGDSFGQYFHEFDGICDGFGGEYGCKIALRIILSHDSYSVLVDINDILDG